MTADEFVDKVTSLMPSVESLVARGLRPDEVDRIRDYNRCSQRSAPVSVKGTDEISKLISLWDMETLRVGSVGFVNQPVKMSLGTQIGWLEEVDPIVLTPENRIILSDRDDYERVACMAAHSPEQFLDALAYAADFLAKCGSGEIDYNDLDVAQRATDRCVALAGGEDCRPFWMSIVG